ASDFSYQIGEGDELTYTAFTTALTAAGFKSGSTTELVSPFEVAYESGDVRSDYSTSEIALSASGGDDQLVLGSSYVYRSAEGAAGDDTFIVTRYQVGDVTISDSNGEDIIKLDVGVVVTDVEEVA
ncbi:MAG: hypothetical protein J4F41_09895, partial [Alphaproteobacteria bacterium]|nr:hypothetical protein [Alphaproteobacteria bacterium]